MGYVVPYRTNISKRELKRAARKKYFYRLYGWSVAVRPARGAFNAQPLRILCIYTLYIYFIQLHTYDKIIIIKKKRTCSLSLLLELVVAAANTDARTGATLRHTGDWLQGTRVTPMSLYLSLSHSYRSYRSYHTSYTTDYSY